MKLAIYAKDGNFVTVLEGINSPLFVGENLVYENGTITDISEQHILLDDNENIPPFLIDAEKIDKKGIIEKRKTSEEEIAERDKRISDLENALLAVLDLLP